MTDLPTWEHYCEGTTKGNAMVFDLPGGLRVWFSYKTPVAFKAGSEPVRVRRNDWGPTTGKHLNAIDGGAADAKKRRVDSEVFERMLGEVCCDAV